MDVERLQQLATDYPEVRELLADNYSLSVAMLAKRMEDRLELFDKNHTRAQAQVVDRVKAIEEGLPQLAKVARALRERIKALEATELVERLEQMRQFVNDLQDRIKALEAAEAQRATEMEQPKFD